MSKSVLTDSIQGVLETQYYCTGCVETEDYRVYSEHREPDDIIDTTITDTTCPPENKQSSTDWRACFAGNSCEVVNIWLFHRRSTLASGVVQLIVIVTKVMMYDDTVQQIIQHCNIIHSNLCISEFPMKWASSVQHQDELSDLFYPTSTVHSNLSHCSQRYVQSVPQKK